MRTKLIAAVLAGGFLLGVQGAAMAQDSHEQPGVGSPTGAKQNPNAAAEYKDKQSASPNSEQDTGRPVPGPHDSR
jgi:hypothetical protein